jgi:hypothetical protein
VQSPGSPPRRFCGQTFPPVRTESKFYPANYFEQVAGAAFAGGPIGPSDTIAVTDNKTQDQTMQVARAIGR